METDIGLCHRWSDRIPGNGHRLHGGVDGYSCCESIYLASSEIH